MTAPPQPIRRSDARPPTPPAVGVRLAGTGHALPETRLTNADLERVLDTSDEWIVQRTGIRERRVCRRERGEGVHSLALDAARAALADARVDPADLDLVILSSVTGDTLVPATSCRIAADLGADRAGAFDLAAACSGFVYGLNIAHDLIRGGAYRTICVIGCDAMSRIVDPSDRRTVILFGDAAGAAVLRPTDDTSKGVLAQCMHADGSRWRDLYLPHSRLDIPEGDDPDDTPLHCLRMRGREVYKFAVITFSDLIDETLAKAGLVADDIDLFIAHQSNARILESARERFGLPEQKMYVNIDRYGNSSAGSVPLCLSELRAAGRVGDGNLVMFVAFGAGLTWASSLWRV